MMAFTIALLSVLLGTSLTYRDVFEYTDVVDQMVFIVHYRTDGGELWVNAAIFFAVDEFAFPLTFAF